MKIILVFLIVIISVKIAFAECTDVERALLYLKGFSDETVEVACWEHDSSINQSENNLTQASKNKEKRYSSTSPRTKGRFEFSGGPAYGKIKSEENSFRPYPYEGQAIIAKFELGKTPGIYANINLISIEMDSVDIPSTESHYSMLLLGLGIGGYIRTFDHLFIEIGVLAATGNAKLEITDDEGETTVFEGTGALGGLTTGIKYLESQSFGMGLSYTYCGESGSDIKDTDVSMQVNDFIQLSFNYTF